MKHAFYEYQTSMRKIRNSASVNYLGCLFFQRQNKALYLLLILIQLVHSMSFNGLYDLPQLLLILTVFGFFAFRKLYHVEYGFLTFVVAYYFQLALTIKALYLIAVQVPFVKSWMTTNKENKFVIIVDIVFG